MEGDTKDVYCYSVMGGSIGKRSDLILAAGPLARVLQVLLEALHLLPSQVRTERISRKQSQS